VESVSAAEASEVLKARLTVMKNNLKASDSKVETAKVDVGVAAGVGVGVDATKIAKGSLLESQTKLAAKNSILRKQVNPTVVAAPQAEPAKPSQPTNIVVVNPVNTASAPVVPQVPATPTAPVVPQVPATPVVQVPATAQVPATPVVQVPATAQVPAAPQVPQVPQQQAPQSQQQNGEQQQYAEVQIKSSQPQAAQPQAASAPTAQTAPTQPQQKSQAVVQNSNETAVNITAAIEEYIAELETKINEQMEAIQKVYYDFREAAKDKMITLAAKLLTQLQALEEAMQKAAEARAAYEKKQNDRTEENKEIVKQFLAEAKKKAEEEKQKKREEIENIIATIKPQLEEAESALREKKENATRSFTEALAAVQGALKAVGEYKYHKLKAQLLLRYPLTAAKLYLYYQKMSNETQAQVPINSTQTIYRAALVESKNTIQQKQRSVGPVVEKAALRTSFLQKQRSAESVAASSEKQQPSPAILVSLNSNKLKQKLKN